MLEDGELGLETGSVGGLQLRAVRGVGGRCQLVVLEGTEADAATRRHPSQVWSLMEFIGTLWWSERVIALFKT